MVLRILQPRIARHVVGVPFTYFGSLISALYDVDDGISRGPPRRHQPVPQPIGTYPSYPPQQYSPQALLSHMIRLTYLPH
ncbi:hypothetical protein CK203_040342 [Vitis vinifera]|uniref:Uncharacterized protein n=1 Tax=Vitis vinifera TaxID=29760 RepID=A0A438FX15_VITVI|nr:hypothetical protein CK203_040342 [Vitis vinifera]